MLTRPQPAWILLYNVPEKKKKKKKAKEKFSTAVQEHQAHIIHPLPELKQALQRFLTLEDIISFIITDKATFHMHLDQKGERTFFYLYHIICIIITG